MKSEDLKGKSFKWISPLTGGETFGEILKVYNYRHERYPLLETTTGNVYPLNECFILLDEIYVKIDLNE